MLLLSPDQILRSVIKNLNLSTEKYIKAAEYISNNIQDVNAVIHEAITNGKTEVDIPELEKIIY